MGRTTITTYGKHRQRMIATDHWSSEDEKQRHVFSFSNSFTSTDSSSNPNSTTKSSTDFQPRLRNGPGGPRRGADKENRQAGKKGKKTSKKLKFVLFSEKESSSPSSSGSDKCDTETSRRVTRRALQDRNQSISPKGYCTRGKSARATVKKEEELCGTNFSEYEDYSLIVSSSPEAGGNKDDSKSRVSAITSTPFHKQSSRDESAREVQDVSIIEAVEDSSPDTHLPRPVEFPSQASLFSTPSPPMRVTRAAGREGATADLASSGTSDSQDRRLVCLEESLQNLHFSRRKFRKRQMSPQMDEGQRRRRRVCLDGSPLLVQVLIQRIDSPSRNKKSQAAKATAASQCKDAMDGSCDLFSDTDLSAAVSPRKNLDIEESIILEEVDTDDDSDNAVEEVVEEESSEEEVEEVEECAEDEEVDDDDLDEPYLATFVSSLSDIEESEEEDEDEDHTDNHLGNETLYTIGNDVSFGKWEEDKEAMALSSLSEVSPASGLNSSRLDPLCEEDEDVTRYNLVDDVDWSPPSEAIEEEPEESSSSPSTASGSRNLSVPSTPSSSDTSSELGFKELLTPTRNKRSGLVESPQTKILHLCGQTDVISFEDCIPPRMMQKCVKIGEGVYGEVFRSKANGQSVALKIIPIEGNFTVNDEPQKTFAEILPEVVISRALSDLRFEDKNSCKSFCQVNSVSCVKGAYPDMLLKQWDKYDEEKRSENDRPDVFDENQLFIVFEFADGGSDLQSFQFEHPGQAKSVLQQVILGLAVAENAIEFEHRDLHIGNVLVRNTKEKSIHVHINGQPFSVASEGVQVCIIDFTLSRLRKDGCTVFCDLSTDETLFEGDGDLQFDVYRHMRDENQNQWETFNPHSNVLWIHYLADKLLHRKRYKSNTRGDRDILKELRTFLGQAHDFTSTKQMVFESDFLKS